LYKSNIKKLFPSKSRPFLGIYLLKQAGMKRIMLFTKPERINSLIKLNGEYIREKQLTQQKKYISL
jgi:hypothetical protein